MPGLKFDRYDFEEAYKKSINDLSEDELERMMSSGSVSCLYRTRTRKAGAMMRVDIYPSYTHRSDQPDVKEKKESTKAQKELNTKRSIERVTELINANFGEGDYLLTLEYDKEHLPETVEAAERCFKNYKERINKRLKKINQPIMSYVVVTEFYDKEGEPVRVHHHVICRCNLSRDMMEELWKYGSRTQAKVARPDKDSKWLSGWASYITKANYERRKGKRRWSSSRGLKNPVETKSYTKFSKRSVEKMIRRYDFKDEFQKRYKGYEFIDYQAYWNEINQSWYVRADLIRSDWQKIKKTELEQRQKELSAAEEERRRIEREKASKKLRKPKRSERASKRR